MKNRSFAYLTSLSLVALCGCNQSAPERSLGRNTALRPEERQNFDQLATLGKTIDEAMAKKDYSRAEAALNETIRLEPSMQYIYKNLGDVQYAAGEFGAARESYVHYITKSTGAISDDQFLVRFGELSMKAGATDDARKAFLAVATQGYRTFPQTLLPDANGIQSLEELHATALACAANFLRGSHSAYLQQTALAVKAGPRAPTARLFHADALYVSGHLADSKDEFEAAMKLEPQSLRDATETFIDRTYAFRNWDHISKGVIGKDGKLTITRIKRRLPNNLPWSQDVVTESKKPISP